MSKLNSAYRLIIISFAALISCSVSGTTPQKMQDKADSLFISAYNFVDLAADTIQNNGHAMDSFYNAIQELKNATRDEICVVPIAHYGDSHIQAGFLTKVIMRNLALDYGNAGRGMIIPHKLCGKNEPADFSVVSPRKHVSATVMDSPADLPIGVSGVAIAAAAPTRYNIATLKRVGDEVDYRFSRILVFHDSLSPIITAADARTMDENGGSDIFRPYTTEINLLGLTDTITLKTYKEDQFSNGPIFGFSLENGSSGIIYHSMGVNGACYLHFGRRGDVARQCAALYPKLIIVSLGSNEASGYNFNDAVFTREMDSFVGELKAENPDAAILLTTPPQAMRRRNGVMSPNTNFERVANAIVAYGKLNNVAVLDLYRVTGGSGSAASWKKHNLMARDGIHYTEAGYKLQGLLIYKALANGLLR